MTVLSGNECVKEKKGLKENIENVGVDDPAF